MTQLAMLSIWACKCASRVGGRRFMAGHSKWANIRHIKGLKDAERSLLFTKLSRQITAAIQENGSNDPTSNMRLAQLIQQAERANMPSNTIQGLLHNKTKHADAGKNYLIDVKGPNGLMLLVEVQTASLKLVKQTISSIARKYSAVISDGGGLHMFERKGFILASVGKPIDDDTLTAIAIECGAEDVRFRQELAAVEFLCDANSLQQVKQRVEMALQTNANGHHIMDAAVVMVPKVVLSSAALSDSDTESCANLVKKLQKIEGVLDVYDNFA